MEPILLQVGWSHCRGYRYIYIIAVYFGSIGVKHEVCHWMRTFDLAGLTTVYSYGIPLLCKKVASRIQILPYIGRTGAFLYRRETIKELYAKFDCFGILCGLFAN